VAGPSRWKVAGSPNHPPPIMSARKLIVFLLFSVVAVHASAIAPKLATFKRGVNISHWLSQNYAERPYAADWFGEEDLTWIAKQGFDHVRFAVDGREWLLADGSLDEKKIAPFEKALVWVRKHGLNAILDMHFLPGASFDPGSQESAVFTDQALQAKVAEFWRKVANRYAHEGDYLRFEILNEPVAKENKQLNAFNRVMLAAIRESNPSRVVYVTSNRWSSFSTITSVEMPDDPHVALTLHFYEPFIFTHQRASWVGCPPDMPLVKFPGRVQDLSALFPKENFLKYATPGELTVAQIDATFATLADWVKSHNPKAEVYIGEFGVHEPADADSKRAYVTAVCNLCEQHGWGWAVWEYEGSFGVRDVKGEPTPILEGLFKR